MEVKLTSPQNALTAWKTSSGDAMHSLVRCGYLTNYRHQLPKEEIHKKTKAECLYLQYKIRKRTTRQHAYSTVLSQLWLNTPCSVSQFSVTHSSFTDKPGLLHVCIWIVLSSAKTFTPKHRCMWTMCYAENCFYYSKTWIICFLWRAFFKNHPKQGF